MNGQDSEQSSEVQAYNLMRQKFDDLVFGGLIAISLIIMQDFIASRIPDISALISVLAFATSIPLLATSVLVELILRNYKNVIHHSFYVHFVRTGGIFGNIIGIDAAFWHISYIAGVVFLISGSVGILVVRYYVNEAEAEEIRRRIKH